MSQEKNILLSIGIPTYNRAIFLTECLESVLISLRGFEEEIEIIISDNVSTDHTEALISSFQKKYSFIRYHKNLENIGPERNCYKLVQLASGKYVWLIGDDDKVLPQAIPTLFKFLKLSYNIVIANYSVWSKDFSSEKKHYFFPYHKSLTFTDANQLMACFGTHFGYITCYIFQKSVFLNVNPSQYEQFVEYGFPHMYSIYSGLLPKCNAIYIPEILTHNRAGNSGGYDWYKYNVTGTSLIFEELSKKGYTPQGITAAKNRLIKDFLAHDVLVRLRDKKSIKGLFKFMLPHYKKCASFWWFYVPRLFIPGFLVRTGYSLLKKQHKNQ